MGDQHKSGDELLREVRALRARLAALERPTAGTAGGEEAIRAVLDHICGFVGVLTPDGTLADVNRSALEAGGFSREQVLGRPFWETGWWDRSPAVQAQLREDVAEAARGRRVRRESTYFTAAGDERVADRTLTPVTDGAGGVVMIVADGLDVTDRRRAEEEVKRAEARFRALVEYQFDGVALSAADGTVLYVSPSARRSAGFADDEVVGHSPFEFIHPDDHDRAARALADALARPREPVTTEYRVRGRDGSWRWVEVVARNLQDEPAVRAVVSNYRDVTERRHAEDALRRAREGLQDQVRSRTAEVEAERARLAEVFRLAPSFMAVLRGPDHVLERANDRFAEFTGGRVPLGRPVRETFPEIEGQGYFEILDRVYRTGEPFVSGDARMMLDRGTGLLDERKFEFVYQPMRDAAGAVAGILLQGVDLTPRIRAEQTLRESEDRFARFMRHLPGAAWMKDLEGRYVYASEAVGRLVGVETAELLGKRDEEFLPPHTAAQFREHDARARAVDSGVRVVETAADPTGVVRHYLVSKFPIRGPGGELSLVGGMAFEITDRIRAEEALRASEERFAQFMRHLPGVAWIKDLEGRHVFANAAFEREFGLAPGGAAGRTNAELFARGVAARYDETDRLALGGGYTAVESDPGVSGPVRHWLVTKFPIPGPDGRPALAGGIAIDVTEQKRAEEELREHAELLDLATDAILVHDPAGALTYWNRGAERLYEWSREEALGRRADALLRTVFPLPREEITAEVARAGHWEGDLTHTRRDGSAVVVASRWTRRLNEGGGLAAILEINTDVTERTQAAELRAQFLARLIAAQEDERGRVARELHDGVAQTLSALHLRVGALTRRPLPAEILGELDELRRAAQAAVEEVRFLARGLRPPVLDELGLLPALTRYAEDFARTHGIRAEVVASGPAGGRLPAEVETALYRIAQEALANVARHSRASAVSVVLLRGPTFVQLLVEDDGAGWDPTSPPADGDAYHHLGLQGMRERAALLGGSLSVESSPGAGTAVCARLPLRGEV